MDDLQNEIRAYGFGNLIKEIVSLLKKLAALKMTKSTSSLALVTSWIIFIIAFSPF
jgi:ribosomal protein L29